MKNIVDGGWVVCRSRTLTLLMGSFEYRAQYFSHDHTFFTINHEETFFQNFLVILKHLLEEMFRH